MSPTSSGFVACTHVQNDSREVGRSKQSCPQPGSKQPPPLRPLAPVAAARTPATRAAWDGALPTGTILPQPGVLTLPRPLYCWLPAAHTARPLYFPAAHTVRRPPSCQAARTPPNPGSGARGQEGKRAQVGCWQPPALASHGCSAPAAPPLTAQFIAWQWVRYPPALEAANNTSPL